MIHKSKIALTIIAGSIITLVIAGFLLFERNINKNMPNILLISIDTCRADYLGCYGYNRPTTPQIDDITRQGMLFQRAQTTVPMTLPAHCSMLSGLYPPTHGVRDNLGYSLDDSYVTIAELLKDYGFTTCGIVSSIVLDKKFGTHQGFDEYYDTFYPGPDGKPRDERTGQNASDLAQQFLRQHKTNPFFLFLHYFDPHLEYEPPEPFATQFADNLYAGEIAYTDQCIGKVIDTLKKLDLYDSTMIVIVGDHGEGLGDHGEASHEYFIYQSTIHIPFIIKGPEIPAGSVCSDAVSLVDIAPTILGRLNQPIPSHIQGIDLSPYFLGKSPTDQPRQVITDS